eukprot:gene18379-25037_t
MARPVSSCLSCRTYKSENYIFIDLYQIYLGARVIVLNVEGIAKPVRSMTYTSCLPIAPGAVLLRGFARAQAQALMASVDQITAQAALRHLQTPGGRAMSVAMSNCGSWGW